MRPPPLFSHLSRRTTSGQFIPEIDGLRFASIALVVVFHLCGYTRAKSTGAQLVTPADRVVSVLGATGHYGVQLFFIISGFVLALPFARHYLLGQPAPRLRAYYLRRLTRLEPPYFVAMIAVFAIAVMYLGESSHALARHLAASLFYAHNLVYGVGSTLNIVAWSLEIEVQFYLLAPLLTLAFSVSNVNVRRLAIVVAMTIAILVQRAGVADDPRLSLTLINYIQYFLVGFLLADIYLISWREASSHPRLWDVAGASCWIALFAVWVFDSKPLISFPVLAFFVFCATFRGRVLRAAFSNPWITTIGGMCYSIYLLHYPLISALGRLTIRIGSNHAFAAHALVQAGLILPILLTVCTLFFVVIERPCMRKDWPQRLLALVRSRGERAMVRARTQRVSS